MNNLIAAFSNLRNEDLIAMAKSLCANKVASVITNNESLKNKKKTLEELKASEVVQALEGKDKQEMVEMCETAAVACQEMSKMKKKF